VQNATGGLHFFLDHPKSPLETTGAAMCAMGWIPGFILSAAHELTTS
jgi:hypothetical protein